MGITVVVARSQNVTSAKRERGTRYVAAAPLGYATPNCQTCRAEDEGGRRTIRCGKPQKCCMREAFTVVATAEQLLQPRQPKCR